MTTLTETVKAPRNLGRMAAVARTDGAGRVLYGNVLDLVAGSDQPKRVRLQRGDPAMQGEVVNLLEGTWKWLWWADEEDP